MSARYRWPRPGAELSPAARALTLLQGNGDTGMTPASVGVVLGLPAAQARRLLETLVRRGKVVRIDDNYRAAPAPTDETPGGVDHVR
ncbi:helix-turn-helix domain-containing protein [Streptomyces sp. NBC_01092]|uniref:helix-turn-helix domain-containing protein n=1 Tax=Streptomyces sp. NBC_01092 TaxID=2903748 RepID=UPI00386A6128|nr:helix-turn-helix domain-containing protein [Streptomyces sp. NBC_01092]